MQPSVLLNFVITSLRSQLDIACRVRDASDLEIVLFDPDYRRTQHVLVRSYRVEVDARGRHAILSRGAQENFSLAEYDSLLRDMIPDEYFVTTSSIVLKPRVKSRVRRTPTLAIPSITNVDTD